MCYYISGIPSIALIQEECMVFFFFASFLFDGQMTHSTKEIKVADVSASGT